MIGLTLGSYFFRRYAAITLWNFIGIAALVFIVNFTEISGRTSGLPGYSPGWALSVAGLQVPFIMEQAVPFVGLISAMATLITLNRKYELVIARSAGISAWQFLTPIAFGALVFGLLTILVLNPLSATAFSTAQAMEASIRGADSQTGSDEAHWIKQRTDEGESVIGADAALDGGKRLVRASFFRIGEAGNIVERLDAAEALLKKGYWQLDDVTVHREGQSPVHLDRTRVETNLLPEFVEEKLARPETVPIYALPHKIEVARSFGLRADAFAMHFHSLIALPALLVAMTLIAATVSMRFARMGQSATMILGGILAGFLLYVVSVLVKAFGDAGFVPPVIAAWTPVVVAMFFGVTFLLYKEDG
jgi:lipopolysaccharide export system permease protein